MTEAFRAELAGITSLVQTAPVSGEAHHTLAWCIGELPGWYAKFCQTHESRYADEILRLEKAVVGELAEAPALPEGQAVGEAVLDRFRLLNERFGLPGLDMPPPRIPRPRSKKAS